MKEFKIKRAMLCAVTVIALTGWFGIIPGNFLKTYAMAISDAMLEQAILEEFGDADSLEDIPDAYYDMDIEQFTQQYLDKLNSGELKMEGFQGETIKNPKLEMTIIENGDIRYTLPNGSYYDANLPKGIVTREAVTITPGSEVIAVVTKDGASTRLFESWRFSEPGNYQIKMIFYQFDSVGSIDTVLYEVEHCFTILERVNGKIGMIPAPDGFEITSAKLDGMPLEIEHPAGLFLEKDGIYEIRFRDKQTGTIYRTTTFERDTTAPFLTFSKELVDGKVETPLEFIKQDVDDQVYIYYNGDSAPASKNQLTAEGRYTLRVEDTAGNSRSYVVELTKSRLLSNVKIILMVLVLLLGSGVSLMLARKEHEVK